MGRLKNRKHIIIISVLGFLVFSIFGILWRKELLEIDSCYKKGGRWNYELKECENSSNFDSALISNFYWRAEYDHITKKEYLVKGKMLDSLAHFPNELIEILNKRKPKCKLEFINLTGDTIIIKVLEDEYLTEQMGTTGAFCFLGETVFTLTENHSVSFVKVEMNYGSHANPGVYNRVDFKDLIKE